jgi:hypothetical protein
VKWQAAVRALDDWMLTDIELGRREIESAIYDSDPGNALLWHASASTDARHFSIAPDPDLINDRSGSIAPDQAATIHSGALLAVMLDERLA